MTDHHDKAIEAAARKLCELDIRAKRRHDTDPAKLEEMLPRAIDYHWPEYKDQARKAIAAYEAAMWVEADKIPNEWRDGRMLFAAGGGLGWPSTIQWNERVGAWDAGYCTLEDWDNETEGYSRPSRFRPLPTPPEGGE